ncbi:MAG: response regulator [Prevotella sp.]|nr:response regulator [Prevotella sp.]
MRTRLLLILLLTIALHSQARNNYIFNSTRVSTLDGLSSNTVRCMLQDQRGYLWFGTSNGLSRYDGYHFVNFSPEDPGCTLVGGHVNELREDTCRSLLWITSTNNSTACYDLQRNTFIAYEQPDLAHDRYSHFFLSSHHAALYDEDRGLRLLRLEDGVLKATDYNVANGLLHHNRVQPLQEDSLHQVWIPTLGGLAMLKADGQLAHLDTTQGYEAVTCRQGKAYALRTDKSVVVYDTNGHVLKQVRNQQTKDGTVWYHAQWNNLWLLMHPDGIMAFDLSNEQFITTPADISLRQAYPIFQDDATLWLAADDNRLYLLTADRQAPRSLTLISQKSVDAGIHPRYRIAKGSTNERYYIAVYGEGLYIYDTATAETRHYTAEDERPLIHSDYILDLTFERSKTLWVSCDFIGLSKITLPAITSHMVFPDNKRLKDRSNFVRKIYRQDSDGNILVSYRDGSLYHYDTVNDRMTLQGNIHSTAYEYFVDSHGRTWIGTRGGGLLLNGKKVEGCPANNIYSIAEDRQGRLWMATLGDRLLMLKPETMEFAQLLTQNRNQRRQHALCIDSDQRLWVGTDDGLYIADTRKQQITDSDFLNFSKQRGNFCQSEIICLKADSVSGCVWSGANNGGAVRCLLTADGQLDYFMPTDQQGLQKRNVNTIEIDPQQNVWIGTDDGLAFWDAQSEIVRWFFFGEDVQSNVYAENSSALTVGGDLLMGTNYGLLRLSPQMERPKTQTEAPLITAISLDDSLLLDLNSQLSFAHNQDKVSISFSNLDYSQTGLAVYTYYLEGREKPWSNVGTTPLATYDALRPGRYTFHVKMMAGKGTETAEQTLTFEIRQPWWNTWWAWLCYLVLTTLVIGLFVRQFLRTLRLRENLHLERNMTEFKLSFFTQISHEFRTPLSIIENGVDQLTNAQSINEGKPWLQSIRRGTARLLKLTNQLLEFRRLNAGEKRLGVADGDIVQEVQAVFMDFWHIANRKELNYTFTPFAKRHTMMFDHQAVETITYNLISNAVKYTPAKGRVTITLKKTDRLVLTVSNSGKGLSTEQQQQLFQPYMHGYVSQGGMGIGLYVAHQLAVLHHGTLSYSAAPEGGSVFTLTLPIDDSVYSEDELSTLTALKTSDQSAPETIEGRAEALNDQQVLIIEDDADMAEQLEREIGLFFRVDTCTDGEQGWLHAKEQHPALVLSDVMLPSMDGYELTRRLKSDEETSHIPVVLLTALGDDKHHVKGIEAGADAYLAKPVSASVLQSLVIKLIKDANSQQHTTSHQESAAMQQTSVEQLIEAIKKEPETVDTIITDMGDKKFRERLIVIVQRRLSDKDFCVDELAQKMQMGRTQFYKKCKEVMGVSPNDYIRNERMRVAAELLQENDMNVNQVAYAVGIDNPSYFIRCFKAKYGVSPSQYKKI